MDSSPHHSATSNSNAQANGSDGVASTNAAAQRFRADQTAVLRGYFDANPRPSAEEIKAISLEVHETERKVKTWFSNWRSKNKSNHPSLPQAPPISTTPTPTPLDTPTDPIPTLVDSVKVRPPPKRVTNFSAASASTPLPSHPEPFNPLVATSLLSSYPPPPDPIPASSLPAYATANIMRLMMSSYFTPCTLEDYEVRRKRKLDDEAANNAVLAAKRGLPIPSNLLSSSASLSAFSIPSTTAAANLSSTAHTPAALPPTALPPHHKAPASIVSSSSHASSFVAKPKSKKELKRAAKLITATLKKLKKASGGGLHPDAAGLLQQAKNLGLLPKGAEFDDGDDDALLSESDSSSSSGSSSDGGSSSVSSSGSSSSSGSNVD
ncbi:hypothetical protein BJ741DRAFT_599854 [Chytriomyces cf. hyalinus JEL632]|nr:hypothetical protein BJ741DRAFT_599854 [Chytriomyces cf. hyalinus JEL632]